MTLTARASRQWLALMLAMVCAACAGGHGRSPCPAGEKCFEVGNASEPFTLDPNKAQLVTESNVMYDMMIGLTTFNAKGETVPGMATSWSTSPDGLTWTFKLRKANWSDGVPVTANDFVASFRRIQDPKTASPYAYLLYIIQGSEAVNAGKAKPETIGAYAPDPQTLVLKLTHPAPYLPLLMVHSSGFPIPAHAVAKWGDKWVDPGHYVSNGPYTLASWNLGDRVVLRRNPKFYEASSVCFDQVSYYPTVDPVSAERRVESGELDMIDQFQSSRADYLRKKLPGYTHTVPILAIYYIPFNLQVPQLKDRRVRLAMAMAVDRDFLTTKIMRAGQASLYGFTPPGLPGYEQIAKPVWATWPFDRRIAAARVLMRKAGYTTDHPLNLELKYSSGSDRAIPAALQADWRRINADISLAPAEGQIHYSELNAKAYQIAVDAWIADYADATTFLQLLATSGGPQNHAGYSSPVYDGLMARADNERDGAKRIEILRQAEKSAQNDWPVIPLYTGSSRALANPINSGFEPNAVDWHLKRFMCRTGPPPGSKR
jgi:oligopeptide transport system substrate-binding protein